MDWTSLLISVGIAGYGVAEYYRRERLHKGEMGWIEKGVIPPPRIRKVEGWQLFTTGGVVGILGVVTFFLLRAGVKAHLRYGDAFYLMGGVALILGAFLLLAWIRDLRLYRSQKESGTEVNQ